MQPLAKALFGALFAYHPRMGRPYGKTKRTRRKTARSPKGGNEAFKIRLCGKDGAPLSMQEVRDGLFEAARKLAPFEGTLRAKRATLYLVMVDEDGKEVLPDPSGEWEIFPYRCAADQYHD